MGVPNLTGGSTECQWKLNLLKSLIKSQYHDERIVNATVKLLWEKVRFCFVSQFGQIR